VCCSVYHSRTSVLQCVAVCCFVLQCVAVCCSVFRGVLECCSVLQCVAVRCSVLQVYHSKKKRPTSPPKRPVTPQTALHSHGTPQNSLTFLQNSPVFPQTALHHRKEIYIPAEQPCISTNRFTSLQRDLYSRNRDLCKSRPTQKSPVTPENSPTFPQMALHFHKPLYITATRPILPQQGSMQDRPNAKEPCNASKQPYIPAEQPCITAKETYHPATGLMCRESPTLKSPIFPPNSLILPPKRPISS